MVGYYHTECLSACRDRSRLAEAYARGTDMHIDVRQVAHPDAVKTFDTAELRRHFLVEDLFMPDEIRLTYSHIERFVVGGASPTTAPLRLGSDKATIGSP